MMHVEPWKAQLGMLYSLKKIVNGPCVFQPSQIGLTQEPSRSRTINQKAFPIIPVVLPDRIVLLS